MGVPALACIEVLNELRIAFKWYENFYLIKASKHPATSPFMLKEGIFSAF